jgi:hypothetical protein
VRRGEQVAEEDGKKIAVIADIVVIARDRKGKLTAEAAETRRRSAKSKTLSRMIADQE